MDASQRSVHERITRAEFYDGLEFVRSEEEISFGLEVYCEYWQVRLVVTIPKRKFGPGWMCRKRDGVDVWVPEVVVRKMYEAT